MAQEVLTCCMRGAISAVRSRRQRYPLLSSAVRSYNRASTAMAESLRALLEPGNQDAAFREGGVADVVLAASEVHHKLSAMHRALVAHDSLNASLLVEGIRPRNQLLDATQCARDQRIISDKEERWLRYFNFTANQAKHHCMTALPF